MRRAAWRRLRASRGDLSCLWVSPATARAPLATRCAAPMYSRSLLASSPRRRRSRMPTTSAARATESHCGASSTRWGCTTRTSPRRRCWTDFPSSRTKTEMGSTASCLYSAGGDSSPNTMLRWLPSSAIVARWLCSTPSWSSLTARPPQRKCSSNSRNLLRRLCGHGCRTCRTAAAPASAPWVSTTIHPLERRARDYTRHLSDCA
mmetsp:Transcript_78266/g.198964  ORF Transcript_78266/g.198964 Transcript_78266/m.198964 type:complete len:205 (-) Transcript_78266:402-1016(-)